MKKVWKYKKEFIQLNLEIMFRNFFINMLDLFIRLSKLEINMNYVLIYILTNLEYNYKSLFDISDKNKKNIRCQMEIII